MDEKHAPTSAHNHNHDHTLNSTGKVILKDHLEHCIVHAVEDGDTEMLTELSDAIDRFVK